MSRTKRLAFPNESRLTEKSGFSKVFAKPVYAKRTNLFSVFAAMSEKPHARLGIVVAKKNIKLAVVRNKLKRLIRESFRQQQKQLCGLDVVVVVKKNFDLLGGAERLAFFVGVGDKHSRCYKG